MNHPKSEDIAWKPWETRQRSAGRHSAARWFVIRYCINDRYAEVLDNERGRTKKFRSEAAANKARDSLNA